MAKEKAELEFKLGREPSPDFDPLCRVVLVEPLIPENTGNIARTCVGTGSELHLIEPLGFSITASRVQRAGLDYWENLVWKQHSDFASWEKSLANEQRVFFIETTAEKSLFSVSFQRGDCLVFGKETSGLSRELIDNNRHRSLRLPILGPVRSFNLSNAVAISVFELLRQVHHQR